MFVLDGSSLVVNVAAAACLHQNARPLTTETAAHDHNKGQKRRPVACCCRSFVIWLVLCGVLISFNVVHSQRSRVCHFVMPLVNFRLDCVLYIARTLTFICYCTRISKLSQAADMAMDRGTCRSEGTELVFQHCSFYTVSAECLRTRKVGRGDTLGWLVKPRLLIFNGSYNYIWLNRTLQQ